MMIENLITIKDFNLQRFDQKKYLQTEGFGVNADDEDTLKKSICSDSHLTRSLKVEEKDKETKHEMEGSKEKERYREKYISIWQNPFKSLISLAVNIELQNQDQV